jgi:malate synthase
MNSRIFISPAPASSEVLTPSALEFFLAIHDRFEGKRQELLRARQERQKRTDAGELPHFLPETANIRAGTWKVATAPRDLEDRRVEITGPAEAKMLINALNCGARVFMADIEDSLSPTWENVIQAQVALQGAVRKTLTVQSGDKTYRLNEKLATLLVRPRGWHLPEAHLQVDGKAVSASLFDFSFFFFHNAQETLKQGSGPYFYLPKMESHLEARLWNDIFCFAQEKLGIPPGTIRATVLIETIFAAFEMDEILYELRDHAAGLNAGRWDYIFSIIKKLKKSPHHLLPDRSQVTMAVPFMRAYCDLLVKTCHQRGAHAMGGMSAFIPNRKDPEVTENALKKVKEDKEREAKNGFDGTWVAHPDLVAIAQKEFDAVLGAKPNQKHNLRADVKVSAEEILGLTIPGSSVSEAGLRGNILVAIEYLERWIAGVGAAALHHLMEDAATAEIARAQIWQWIHHQVKLADGRIVTNELYISLRDQELKKLKDNARENSSFRYDKAVGILDQLILNQDFPEFLTLLAYPLL